MKRKKWHLLESGKGKSLSLDVIREDFYYEPSASPKKFRLLSAHKTREQAREALHAKARDTHYFSLGVMEDLSPLQITRLGLAATKAPEALIEKLRATIDEPIQAHYDTLGARATAGALLEILKGALGEKRSAALFEELYRCIGGLTYLK